MAELAEMLLKVGLPLHEVNGVLVPRFVRQENVDKLKDLELYPDDVWVVSYPKCGNTWTQQIVRLIRNNGVQDDVFITTAVPWVEAGPPFNSVDAENVPRPRAFKSHFLYDAFPCGPPHTTPCKYIYVVRNPKDVAVSLYFYGTATLMEWESWWKKYVSGDVVFGKYIDHLLSWLPHKNDKNVLFLKYEDMKKDLPKAVSQIASFLEVDLSSDVIDKIADLTSFDKMKNDNTANSIFPLLHQVEGATKFMRKGVVGDWKNHLTAEQSSEIDAIFAERLNGISVDFQYE
jgi:hypothetical protein